MLQMGNGSHFFLAFELQALVKRLGLNQAQTCML